MKTGPLSAVQFVVARGEGEAIRRAVGLSRAIRKKWVAETGRVSSGIRRQPEVGGNSEQEQNSGAQNLKLSALEVASWVYGSASSCTAGHRRQRERRSGASYRAAAWSSARTAASTCRRTRASTSRCEGRVAAVVALAGAEREVLQNRQKALALVLHAARPQLHGRDREGGKRTDEQQAERLAAHTAWQDTAHDSGRPPPFQKPTCGALGSGLEKHSAAVNRTPLVEQLVAVQPGAAHCIVTGRPIAAAVAAASDVAASDAAGSPCEEGGAEGSRAW